jgi:uroporphyrinogen decarboxylase
MRQAGRYLEGYRNLRARHSFTDLCESPDLAVEVSLLPHHVLGVDAVIVFYDILIPLERMGAPLEYTDRGPAFREPLRTEADVEKLGTLEPERHTPAILETIRRLKTYLGSSKPVLGFAGAPFTLAAYLLAGEMGSGGEEIRRAIHRSGPLVHRLLDRLADAVLAYLNAQIGAGADLVQLFDTWAGLLSPADYREFALPYQQKILGGLLPTAPSILYVNGGDHLLEDMGSSGAGVVSIDWRGDLARARARLGPGVGLQGNLDPAALFASPGDVRSSVRGMLESMRGDPAYLVNLGHGILPDTPLESAKAMVDAVHEFE